jgi:hypothetical protein
MKEVSMGNEDDGDDDETMVKCHFSTLKPPWMMRGEEE